MIGPGVPNGDVEHLYHTAKAETTLGSWDRRFLTSSKYPGIARHNADDCLFNIVSTSSEEKIIADSSVVRRYVYFWIVTIGLQHKMGNS